MNVWRLCLTCRRVFSPGDGRDRSRCVHCQGRKPTTLARRQDREMRQEAVWQWLAEIGPRCPGAGGRSPHGCRPEDLTADHDPPGVAVSSWRELGVLCRACNAAKGAGARKH